MQSDVAARLKTQIQPVLDEQQVELIDLIYRRESGRDVLRFLVDKPGGITLEDCAALNREIGGFLEGAGLIERSFVLEVNSPGLDRPLVGRRDYERHIGDKVRLILRNEKGATDIVAGGIKSVADDRVILNVNGAESAFLFCDIIKAKLEIDI